MKAAETAFHHSALDRAAPEAGGGEVRGRHDTLPARGELGDDPVDVAHRAPTGQSRPDAEGVSVFWTPAV
jgi:hypothetical protein